MTGPASRVKILCVRPQRNPDCAAILHTVIDEWVHALALHCDVEMIEEDFDLVEVYERVKPDFLLFDSVHWGRRHRLNIANIQAYPELPRALLLNCDPHDPMRPLMFDALPSYGIDTIFCLGTEQLQQMNELRRFNCFIIPKFIDASVFRNYDEPRSIPVTIPSAHLFPSFYPWRAQVTAEIQQLMPTMLYTHPGYSNGGTNPFEIRDESYAQMLSRSKFCIADTTALNYVVRKHLEIPAAGSILVSPKSEALEDYGFIDMKNCILGDAGPDLYKKIWAVACDPGLYERIRSNGHSLVHRRYTRQTWTYVLDWFTCRQNLKPGQKVQQKGVFGTFRAVPDRPDVSSIANLKVQDNPMSVRLRAAREALLYDDDLKAAADGLQETMTWIGHIAEPWFMLGIISFAIGDLESAANLVGQRCALQRKAGTSLGLLDPCEIAWLLLIAHLRADRASFEEMSKCAAATSHVSIRRVQWLIDGAKPVPDLSAAGLDKPRPGDCLSIHWLGDEDMDSWCALILRAHAARDKLVQAKAA